MRQWWASRPPSVKRAYLDKRAPDKRKGRVPPPRAPEKEAARRAAANGLRNGTLTRAPCEVCGTEKVDAHHEDYNEPLTVRWLCRAHHMREHRIYRDAEPSFAAPLSTTPGPSAGDGQDQK